MFGEGPVKMNLSWTTAGLTLSIAAGRPDAPNLFEARNCGTANTVRNKPVATSAVGRVRFMGVMDSPKQIGPKHRTFKEPLSCGQVLVPMVLAPFPLHMNHPGSPQERVVFPLAIRAHVS